MASLITIIVSSSNQTQAGFAGVQSGLQGIARTSQQTAATMNVAFRGVGAQLLGGFGIATGIGEAAGQLGRLAQSGQRVQAQLDATRGSLAAVTGSQARATDIFAQASIFADRYSLTQSEMAGAIQASSQIIRTSQQPIENILGTLARLQILSPEQGLQGAALALRELTSGDTRSLVGRFEVTRDAANAMKREILGGADAVAVLGRYLTSVGITDGAIEASLAGAAGQQREWNRAVEELGIAINQVATEGGIREWATGVVEGTTGLVKNFREMSQEVSRSPVIRFLDQLEDRLSRPLHDYARWVGAEEPIQNSLTQAREERDRRPVDTGAARPPQAPPPVRFAGFASEPDTLGRAAGRTGRSLTAPQNRGVAAPQSRGVAAPQSGGRVPSGRAPQSRGATPVSARATMPGQSRGMTAPQITVNIYPQGLVHSSRDLADYMRDAAKDDSFRNAIEVLGNR